MEKLGFTLRFVVLLAALPAIMFIELTRTDKTISRDKQNTQELKTDEAMVGQLSVMQAVYN